MTEFKQSIKLEKKGTDKDARTALENVNSTVCSGDEFRKILVSRKVKNIYGLTKIWKSMSNEKDDYKMNHQRNER